MKINLTEHEQSLLLTIIQGYKYSMTARQALFQVIDAALVDRGFHSNGLTNWFVNNVEKTNYNRFLPLERIAENLPLRGSFSQKEIETIQYMEIVFGVKRKTCRTGVYNGKTGYENFRLIGDTKNVYDKLENYLQEGIRPCTDSFLSYEEILQSIPEEIRQELTDDETKVKKFILATVECSFHIKKQKTRDKRYTNTQTIGFFGLEVKDARA